MDATQSAEQGMPKKGERRKGGADVRFFKGTEKGHGISPGFDSDEDTVSEIYQRSSERHGRRTFQVRQRVVELLLEFLRADGLGGCRGNGVSASRGRRKAALRRVHVPMLICRISSCSRRKTRIRLPSKTSVICGRSGSPLASVVPRKKRRRKGRLYSPCKCRRIWLRCTRQRRHPSAAA